MTEESIYQQIDSAFKVYKKHSALKFEKVKPNKPCEIKISFCEQDHGQWWILGEANEAVSSGPHSILGPSSKIALIF